MAGINEVGFGTDDFGKPLVLSVKESILQLAMNVLLCKPGNFPSMPNIGIDIKAKLEYITEDDISVEELQQEINEQLQLAIDMNSIGDVKVFFDVVDTQPIVAIKIPLLVDPGDPQQVLAGFTLDQTKQLVSTIELLTDNQ